MREKLVVIGNGMAPGRMLEQLFEAAPGRFDVTIFNAEPRVNYDRIMLSPVLSGEKSFEEIVIHGDGWYIEHGIILYKGHRVTGIDREAQAVRSEHGAVAGYDKLVIATGSVPVRHPGAGPRPAGRPHLSRPRRRQRHAARRPVGRPGRRHRRRPARARGGRRPADAGHGRHRAPPDADADGTPARSGRGLSSAEGARGSRHRGHHQGQHEGDPRATVGSKASGSTTARKFRPTSSSWRSASGPNAALAREAGLQVNRGIVVNDQMQTSDPAHLCARRMRRGRRQLLRPRRAALPDGQRRARRISPARQTAVSSPRRPRRELKVTGIDLYLRRRLRRGGGPRGDRAARRGRRRLQAPGAQGQPHHRRGAVRRHRRRRLGSST